MAWSSIIVGKSKQLIYKSNALVDASHRLSLTEQRIVLFAITQIRRDQKPSSEAWYTVSANDLATIAGISISRAYHDLADSVESLWKREIVVRGGPNGSKKTTDGGRLMKTRWIQAVDYLPNDGHGVVKLMFTAPITPYLADFAGNFTRYELQYVAPMKSRFGPRLYELLMRKINTKDKALTMSLDDLQALWCTTHKRPYDVKKWVITPAVEDVNQVSDITTTVEYRKTGRLTTHVHFKFKSKNKPKELKDMTDQEIDKAGISVLGREGESYDDLRARLTLEEAYILLAARAAPEPS
jgi:plasmid replication initiation protein